jgi:hypothetical protein
MNDVKQLPAARDGRWAPGERAVFHYSLPFDENSEICARLHGRTGQIITVIREAESDANFEELPTFAERAEAACLAVYAVRFPDGHEDTAFEDELVEVVR